MEAKRSFLKTVFGLSAILLIIVFAGCKDSLLDAGLTEPLTDHEAYLQLISEDSAMVSFEPNYNEDDAMAFFGKVNTEIYPFRVGHKVHIVNRALVTETIGDTTYGTVTTTFEGTLLIGASYSADSTKPDTLIKKPFTSIVTRKVIFQKVARTNRPLKNWKIAAISLPQGGTATSNIEITKLTISYAGGESIVITSPNEYFLIREKGFGFGHGNGHGMGIKFGHGFLNDMPLLNASQEVKLQLEVTSAYADSDFVTITYGGMRNGNQRSKKKFDLISSNASGDVYLKVYEQTYVTNNSRGFFHAVINAMPKQVVYDDATSAEIKMWGVPYSVK